VSRYEIIWKTVQKIPYGRVATYGQIALEAGMEGQARLVGYALHATPRGLQIPWHRVINSAGRISLPGLTARRQKALLEKEGIQFSPAGKVNLKLYQWKTSNKDLGRPRPH
jgi:methylated-DNA-protein-cysteine methyltransferase-like protein